MEVEYASAVTEIDNQFGIVMQALEDEGLSNNTVVFFASDNGASNEGGHSYEFFNSSGPLNGFKRSLHEGGHRSPLIVRWSVKLAAPIGVDVNLVLQWTVFCVVAGPLCGESVCLS